MILHYTLAMSRVVQSCVAIRLSLLSTFLVLLSLSATGTTQTPSSTDVGNGYVIPGPTWERIPPESAGFSASRLEALRAWLKAQPTTAMMVVYRGKVVFDYGDTALVSKIASVRKSILDMLFAAELRNIVFNPHATVKQLGLDDKQPFVHPEEEANLEQLLASRSGIYLPTGDRDQEATLPKRGSEYPGAHFVYNNWDFNALGTAFEKLTHKDIYKALQDDLARPLALQDFDLARQHKNFDPVSVHPEYAMYLSTRDLARLGLLMLYKGRWAGKQLLDPGLLDASTTLVTPFAEINPTGMRVAGLPARWGYGALWWVWDAPVFPGNTYNGPYQGAYSAMGSGGQFLTVFPMLDLVVVHKVDIDANPRAAISSLGYQAILDMLLDAKCSGPCK
jgi:CubicO group peptidase (beta-lactamase class C family)